MSEDHSRKIAKLTDSVNELRGEYDKVLLALEAQDREISLLKAKLDRSDTTRNCRHCGARYRGVQPVGRRQCGCGQVF